jgi:hypothetical protein
MPMVGDLERRRDLGGELDGYHLQHQGERARVLDRKRVLHELLGLLIGATLHAPAAQCVHRLWGQPDVTHHGNACLDDLVDGGGGARTPLELDGLGCTLLDKPPRVLEGDFRAHLVAHERHIDGQVSRTQPASDASAVVDHVLEGHAQGVRMALDDHADAVADEDDVDVGGIDQTRHGGVIGGDHGDLCVLGLHSLKVQYGLAAHDSSHSCSQQGLGWW